MTNKEQTVKSIDTAFDEYLSGKIDDIELRDRCDGDGEALCRLAHIYRDDERIVSRVELCAITLFHALRNGCEDAGWEILEAPERATEDIGSPLNPRRRAIWDMMWYRVDGLSGSGRRIGNLFPDMEAVAEMARRSRDHPEIAAAIVCSNLGYSWIDDYADWAALAGSAFRPQVAYSTAMRHLWEHDPSGGLPFLRESASLGNSRALLTLGELEFLGYGLPRSLPDAKKHIGMAAADGVGGAFPWISLFNDLPFRERSGKNPTKRASRLHGQRRHFHMLPCQMSDLPELEVIDDIACLDPCRYGGDGTIGLEDGSILNGTFLYRPFRSERTQTFNDMILQETPNFCFLPTGFEIVWDNEEPSRIRMNRYADYMDVRRILRMCIQSVMDDMDGGAAE